MKFDSRIVGQALFGEKWAKRLFRWKLRYWHHWAFFAITLHFCSFSSAYPNLGKVNMFANNPFLMQRVCFSVYSSIGEIANMYFKPFRFTDFDIGADHLVFRAVVDDV